MADGEFFKVVRSTTPPGEPIQLIATRRPYDDPGVARVYYRFWRDHSTTLDKTHMPYALDDERLAWLDKLFLEPQYTVAAMPSYAPEQASNPFITFSVIPADSRWRFLRAEGQFTVMNFIKGPVCRGQTALSVIRDNFWVFFDSDKLTELYPETATAFLNQQKSNLSMPAAMGSDSVSLPAWKKYSKLEQAYMKARPDVASAA